MAFCGFHLIEQRQLWQFTDVHWKGHCTCAKPAAIQEQTAWIEDRVSHQVRFLCYARPKALQVKNAQFRADSEEGLSSISVEKELIDTTEMQYAKGDDRTADE